MIETEKQEILDAIGRVEAKLDQKSKDDEARFQRLEEELAENSARDEYFAKKQAEFADALGKCASAAAHAVDISLGAQRRANDATDEATKVVTAAMTIHSTSVAAAVKTAIQPLADEVDVLKKNDVAQNAQFKLVLSMLGTLAKWQNHWAFKVGLLIAGIAIGVWGLIAKTH